jgi:hypothetical protein
VADCTTDIREGRVGIGRGLVLRRSGCCTGKDLLLTLPGGGNQAPQVAKYTRRRQGGGAGARGGLHIVAGAGGHAGGRGLNRAAATERRVAA